MQAVALSQTTARTETPAQQSAPMPLDLDALRHVVGGGPGGSWADGLPPV